MVSPIDGLHKESANGSELDFDLVLIVKDPINVGYVYLICFEFDGKQHLRFEYFFNRLNNGQYSYEKFLAGKVRDAYKILFSQLHGLPLIKINYFENWKYLIYNVYNTIVELVANQCLPKFIMSCMITLDAVKRICGYDDEPESIVVTINKTNIEQKLHNLSSEVENLTESNNIFRSKVGMLY